MKPKYLLLIAFILISQSLHALPDSLNVAQWAKALSDKNDKQNLTLRKICPVLNAADSSTAFHFLDELEIQGKQGNIYFRARFNMLRAFAIQTHIFFKGGKAIPMIEFPSVKKVFDSLLATSVNDAYSTEDEYLIAYLCNYYSRGFQDVGLRIMYNLNGITLSEKLSLDISPYDYQHLAESLYRVQEYDSCIKYMHKAVAGWQKSPPGDTRPVSCLNTIGVIYQKGKNYDSAFTYYTRAFQYAKQMKDTIWIGIISGNVGQIYYELGNYDTARALLTLAYKNSLPGRYYAEAANALQRLAKIDLATGKKEKALNEVRAAFQFLNLWHDASYLRNVYYTVTQVFKTMGIYDSAFYYNNLYTALNDSLEQVVAANSLSITRARMNDLNSRYKIQSLNREKQATITTRNMMIGGVTLVALLALLLINRKRLKAKHEQEKAEQERLLMQQQMVSAQEQLKMFTENIVEKSTLIEKLEQQTKPDNVEQATIVKEIIHQTILTEDDWLQFKTLFEKAHPGFFDKLREQVNDISLAEIRMAALTRLKLTTKQMADVLGISTNSIVKAKQRLRQRFNLPTNYEVETFIAKL